MKKKMNLGIFLIALGMISMAVLGAIGTKLIQNANAEISEKNKKETLENQDRSKNELSNKIDDSKESILSLGGEISESISDLKQKKGPDISIKNSPNTVIQINEDGDNIVDKRTTIVNSNVDETAKPILRINEFSIGKNSSIDPKYEKYENEFNYSVTNHGERTAYNLVPDCFFFEKLKNNSIGRSNIKGFDEEFMHHNDLIKGETMSFIYPFTISEEEGIEQLNSTMLMFKMEYLDKLTGEENIYTDYYQFRIKKGRMGLYPLRKRDIELINNFLKDLKKK